MTDTNTNLPPPVEKKSFLAGIQAAALSDDIKVVMQNWVVDQPGETLSPDDIRIFLMELTEIEQTAANTLSDARRELSRAAEDEDRIDERETIEELEIMHSTLRDGEQQVALLEQLTQSPD